MTQTIIILIILVAIPLIVALFVRKSYIVARQILIEKPLQDCYAYLKFIKNQEEFSVWNKIDPNMKKTYSGTDGTVGFTYAWDSTNKLVGQGEQTISSLVENDKIVCNLHFIKPFENDFVATLKLDPNYATATRVTWSVTGSMKYPKNIMLLFMNMDKMIAPDLANGLLNLKERLEK